MAKTYYEKLKDPRWQKKRLDIMNRDNFTCLGCGSEDNQLQVHHLKYGKDPWDIGEEHLLTLCEDCHKKVTDINNSITDLISQRLMSDGNVLSIMNELKSFVEVFSNCNEPWGVDSEYVNNVVMSCVEAAKNRGYWEGLHANSKKA